MANIELRHLDCTKKSRYTTVEVIKLYSKSIIGLSVCDKENDKMSVIYLDKSTAIRLSKSLRTEINKIKE